LHTFGSNGSAGGSASNCDSLSLEVKGICPSGNATSTGKHRQSAYQDQDQNYDPDQLLNAGRYRGEYLDRVHGKPHADKQYNYAYGEP
jgi:hypothetical protein